MSEEDEKEKVKEIEKLVNDKRRFPLIPHLAREHIKYLLSLLSSQEKRIEELEKIVEGYRTKWSENEKYLERYEKKIEELEKPKSRSHTCVWCKEVLFDKPSGQSPTDEEAKQIAHHIQNCPANPLVQHIRKLEEGLRTAVQLIKQWHNFDPYHKLGIEAAETMWKIYYQGSPEMEAIRKLLEK